MPIDDRVLSRPCAIHWAGWKTDSYTLERMGWALSAIQCIDMMRIRLGMRHVATGITMMAEGQEFDFLRHRDRSRSGMDSPLPVFTVCNVDIGARVQVINGDGDDFASFDPISARPLYTSHAIKDLDDYKIFATQQTQGIIVDPNSIDSLIQQIQKLNQPDLAEIRERNRARDRRNQPLLHAQILTFAA